MRFLKLITLLAMSFALFACGDGVIFGPAGTSTIIGTGGNGATGAGGNGASIDIFSYGDVKINASGAVDTSFAMPALNSNFGAVPVEVSSDTTVAFVNISTSLGGTTKPEAGTLFVANDSNWRLYRSTGPGTDPEIVTGLKVDARATLTIPGNGYTGDSVNGLYIWLDDAIEINGTIINTADDEALDIESGNFLKIGPTGKVTTVSQTAGGTSADIYLYSDGSAINQGIIDASGPSGGGNAGEVELEADNIIYNTGSLLSVGGDNTAGAGGTGDVAVLISNLGSVYSSGTINVSGGKGSTTGGGVVNGIVIYAADGYAMGRLFVGGSLLANGGEGLAGAGGSAGFVDIFNYVNHGALRSSASISAKGGASSAGFDGATGGRLFIVQAYYNIDWGKMASEPIQVSGNIDVSGGSGGVNGGSAGFIMINNANRYYVEPSTSAVELYGYASITAKGGKGATNGGYGGFVVMQTTSNISNGVPITVTGGDGAIGGDARSVVLWAGEKLVNMAAILCNGGAGTTAADGGAGGYIELYDGYGVNNSGTLNVTGGTGKAGAIRINGSLQP